MKKSKIIILLFSALFILTSVNAYDIENQIATTDLPKQIIEPLSASVSDSNINIYINSTSSWIDVPNSIYIEDFTNIIYFNATINVPANTSKGDYVEYVNIRKAGSTTDVNISFLIKIIDINENITYNKTNLIIEIRDIITENVLKNISLRLTDGADAYEGVTDNNGQYTFENMDMKKWLLYITNTDYEPVLSPGTISKVVYLDEINEFKSFYVINKTLDLDSSGVSFLTLLFKLFEAQNQDELDFQESQTMTYINNTVFETAFINKEGWYELIKCNPQNIASLETSVEQWSNQSTNCMNALNYCVANVSQTQEELDMCFVDLEHETQWKKYSIVISIAGTLVSIIILIGGFFGYKEFIAKRI